MSHGVVAQTQFAGSTKGTYVDDLARVGNWPRAQDIKRITKITVYKGAIIDRLVITYQVGDAFVTVQHGGDTGNVQPDINIGNDEKIVAVYGTRLRDASPYGEKNIVQISFIIAKSSGNAPTVRVETVTGNATGVTEKFDLSWALVAVSSFSYQPQGKQSPYLQGIGFSKVLGLPGPPLL